MILAARQDTAHTRVSLCVSSDLPTHAHSDMQRMYGRGGAGNAAASPSKSRSRSRSVGPLHSSGRGGAGNLHPGIVSSDADALDDRRARAMSPEGR